MALVRNEFPYTNFHELNLDWILTTLNKFEEELQNFIALNTVKYANPIQWDITTQYAANTVVVDRKGVAYLSVQAVPSGVTLDNVKYWTPIFNFGVSINELRKFIATDFKGSDSVTSNVSKGELFWSQDVLYVALVDISAGSKVDPDVNAETTTVDSAIKNIISSENLIRKSGKNIEDTAEESYLNKSKNAIYSHAGDLTATASHINVTGEEMNLQGEVLSIGSGKIKIDKKRNYSTYFDSIPFFDSNGEYDVLVANEKTAELKSSSIILNVSDFGAKGDGETDDWESIQNAIDTLPKGGGIVLFPAGVYMISKTIKVGNGKAAVTDNGEVSTMNAIKLIGMSGDRVGSNSATEIKPMANIGAIIQVNGKIDSVEIKNMTLFCDGKSDFGLHITAVSHSTFDNIYIYNPKYCGLGVYGGKNPTGNYCIGNVFSRILVSLATSTTIGLEMNGVLSAKNDSWLTKFELCRFQIEKGAVNCTAALFKFVDSVSFFRCHFVGYDESKRGIEFNAIENNTYPAGMSFYDCSIDNTIVTENTDSKMRKCYFIGYGTYDGEEIPSNEKLIGITDTGVPFNGWGGVEYYPPRQQTFNESTPAVLPSEGEQYEYILSVFKLDTNTFSQLAGVKNAGETVYSSSGVTKSLVYRRIK